MFFVFLLTTRVFSYKDTFQAISKSENVDEITYEGVTGNYNNNDYVQSHSIKDFTYSSTGDYSNRPLENAFDGSTSTFWVSQNPNSDSFRNSININFAKTVLLDAILYHMAYSTSGESRTYHGAPLKLNIYSSISNEPLQLRTTFVGIPANLISKLQLVFNKPILCDHIQIEFVEVTPNTFFTGGSTSPSCSVINFMGEAMPETIYEGVTGNYNNNNYVQSHSIKDFTYSSTGDKSGKPLSNLFDGSTSTFWVSQNPNSDSFRNSIYINFTSTVSLEAILYHMAYSTSGQSRRFDGAPLKLNIYSSLDNGPFQLHTIFVGTPAYPMTRLQLVFNEPIICDRIQIEFVEVTPEQSFSSGAYNAAGSVMIFMGEVFPKITYKGVAGRYENQEYLQLHSITSFSSSSTGDKNGNPLGNLLDGSTSTFWVSQKPNSDSFHNSIYINFTKTVSLEAILYHMAYSTIGQSSRRFDGAPLKLYIYSSIGNNPLQLCTIFVGTPVYPMTRLQLVFNEPIICDRIQIEFVEVTPERSFSSGAYNAAGSVLMFVGTQRAAQFTFTEATGDYSNDNWAQSNEFKSFTKESSGDKPSKPLSNLFDSSLTTYWVSQNPNSDSYFNTIKINFDRTVQLKAIRFDTAYRTITQGSERFFGGAPSIFNIFTSVGDEKLELEAIFGGTYNYNCEKMILLFNEPVICDHLLIEFDKVSEDIFFSNNATNVVFGGLHLFGSIAPEFATFKGAEGNYTRDFYVNYCKVQRSSFVYKTDGDKPNYPSSNLFDDSTTSFWSSSLPNNDTFHNTISFNFTEPVTLEAILYDCAYSTSGQSRRFDGIPTKLNVYFSLNDEPFTLNTTFTGSAVFPWTRLQFVFNKPITCNKLILEFAEVTPDVSFSTGSLCAASGGLFLVQPYKRSDTKLKPLFLASGFNGSPLYATVTKPDLYPECPRNLNRVLLTSKNGNNNNFLNNNADCVAKLLRVQLNTTTGKVEQLPGITTDSSPIGEYSQLLSYDSIIDYAHLLGYLDGVNLFGVGYNYILHPATSYDVYDKLKAKIEEVYEETHEKVVIMGHSQGTSFVSIFISNYSDVRWAKKYVDSVVFLAPAFAGWASFSRLFSQSFSPFKTCDELKKSIMRMPGLHIMMPNYAVFGDRPVIYNMNNDFDQHDATHSVPYLKSLNKMDDESEEIFKAYVENFLKEPIPEPPVPSFILYNDKITTNVGYVNLRHQPRRVVSTIPTPGDGTVTSEGPEYACGHWKNTKCVNLNDGSAGQGGHLQMTSNPKAINAIMNFVLSDKSVKEKPKQGIFLASGFQGSPIYATVTDPSKAPMCPSNLKNYEFYTVFNNNIWKFIDDANQSYWLSKDCLSMLSRVELDKSEQFVTYAPGIHLSSSRFGEYFHLLSYDKIIKKFFDTGYTLHKDLFGVGYNYMLHPLMSGEVYENLKTHIEKYYNETGMKSIITGHSQGTSFVQIFITDYVSREWAQKYVDGVIFYAPAFSGWGTYGRSVSGNYGGIFPNNYPAMQTSTARMPGLHIMMPNEGVYGSKTVIRNFPNNGDQSNASFVAPLLKQLNRMDDTAFKIFKLTDKYRKPPLPEPPVPSLVIYNNKRATGNGYTYNPNNNGVSTFSGTGDGTVSDDGPSYACSHWKHVTCYNYYADNVDHSNIQTNQKTIDLTMEFIAKVKTTPLPTPPPPLLPDEFDEDTFVYNVFNDTTNGRFLMEEMDNTKVLIIVNVSNFTGISVSDEGGAIHILNTGIYCIKTGFINCISQITGGAIYLKNNYTIPNAFHIEDAYFERNEALYGGACYIYSSSIVNQVVVMNCDFVGNKAKEQASSTKKYGGNAIFLTARIGWINSCSFHENEGVGSDLRAYNHFIKGDVVDSKILSSVDQSFIISNCNFNISKKSSSCIYYVRGDHTNSMFEIKDCKFNGELAPTASYIDGKTLSELSPNLIVKNCLFSSDFKKSIALKDLRSDDSFISIIMKQNSFFTHNNDKKFILTGNMLLAAVIPTVALVCIAILVIIYKKKDNSSLEIREELSDEHNTLYRSSTRK